MDAFDGYVQTSSTARRGNTTSTTTQRYDANGQLSAVTDSVAANSRTIINDAQGRALWVNQGGNVQRQLIVDGQVLGRYGVGPDPIKPKDSSGKVQLASLSEFSFGYQGISGNFPGPAPGSYAVQAGDTLQTIARGAYGDSQQWYRIAQANGLRSSAELKVGQTLTIPTGTGTARNTATEFKPYDASKIVGDTTPSLPMPAAGGGCGGFGQVIMIAVAIAVTIYTAGALSGATGSLMGTMQAGMGVMSGGLAGGSIGAAAATSVAASSLGVAGTMAVAAGVGSIASQAVGIAIGAQDSFSWKQVALSAVSAGVTQVVTQGFSGTSLAANTTPNIIVRTAISGALTQGIGVATGLQKQFNWRAVAASAVGVGVGDAIGESLGLQGDQAAKLDGLQRFARSAVTGITTGTVTALARGGRVSVQQVATDAFGNALGESIKDQIVYGGSSDTATAYNDGEIGRSEMRVSTAPAPDLPDIAGLRGRDGFEYFPPVDRSNDLQLAAGDGFTMGRGPMSVGQAGRTIYISDQGQPSIDSMLAQAKAGAQRLRDEALTAELNRNSAIRETVVPMFEPIAIEIPPVVSAAAAGIGDVATGAIAVLADMTVAPIADVAQAGFKALQGAVTGDYQPLRPLSSFGEIVVNGGSGTWDGIKATGTNVFNVSPLGVVYHTGTSAYGLTTAAMAGDVRAATREGLGLGLNFVGAAAVPAGLAGGAGRSSFLVQAETSALQRMALNNLTAIDLLGFFEPVIPVRRPGWGDWDCAA